ncbi:MAG: DNA repair protein RecO [Bacilli bacterium]|nr:DNA repair protein RecO [Bacilli bacterium]
MIKKIEGIIVSEVDYKESSKIINIFTPTDGVMGIVARGTKKVKSNLSGVTSKLTYGYFHVNYKDNGLSTLIEVDILDGFKKIRKNIDLISYASYLLELCSMVYKHDSNPDIYNLLISSLKKIEEGYDYEVITNILELKLLEYLGIKPVIDGCVNCGSKVDIVTISSYKGGYLCKNCAHDEVIVNIKTIKLLRMFYYVDINKISKLDVSDNIKKELNRFIDDYYDRYSGLYLKSKIFLKNLQNI